MKFQTNQSPLLITCMMFILMILASACNHSAKKLSTANLETEVMNKIESHIQFCGDENKTEEGADIFIIVDGKPYSASYKKEGSPAFDTPVCEQQHCSNFPETHQICHELPPGSCLLICNGITGECCFCIC